MLLREIDGIEVYDVIPRAESWGQGLSTGIRDCLRGIDLRRSPEASWSSKFVDGYSSGWHLAETEAK